MCREKWAGNDWTNNVTLPQTKQLGIGKENLFFLKASNLTLMLSEVDDSEHHHLFLNQIHEIKVFLIFISHFELDGVRTGQSPEFTTWWLSFTSTTFSTIYTYYWVRWSIDFTQFAATSLWLIRSWMLRARGMFSCWTAQVLIRRCNISTHSKLGWVSCRGTGTWKKASERSYFVSFRQPNEIWHDTL